MIRKSGIFDKRINGINYQTGLSEYPIRFYFVLSVN